MLEADAATRMILMALAAAVLQARRARRWTQRRLAAEAKVSQSVIARFERLAIPQMPIATAIQILAALDIPIDLRLQPPLALVGPRDAAHARCITHVIRLLRGLGFVVESEVEVGGPGWTGSIDIVAYHPIAHVLLVIEVKTELHDLGALDRQLARYERAAWDAARGRGWRPRAVTGAVLLFWTERCDDVLREQRTWFEYRFALRARDPAAFLDMPERSPERGARAIAMIDPRSRRSRWLVATPMDGRHSRAPYLDRLAFLDGRRTR